MCYVSKNKHKHYSVSTSDTIYSTNAVCMLAVVFLAAAVHFCEMGANRHVNEPLWIQMTKDRKSWISAQHILRMNDVCVVKRHRGTLRRTARLGLCQHVPPLAPLFTPVGCASVGPRTQL